MFYSHPLRFAPIETYVTKQEVPKYQNNNKAMYIIYQKRSATK